MTLPGSINVRRFDIVSLESFGLQPNSASALGVSKCGKELVQLGNRSCEH